MKCRGIVYGLLMCSVLYIAGFACYYIGKVIARQEIQLSIVEGNRSIIKLQYPGIDVVITAPNGMLLSVNKGENR